MEPSFKIIDHGRGGCTVELDHGLVDEKGRALGGDAHIYGARSEWSLRIQATRDGVSFGALRRETVYNTRENAVAAGKKKLVAQGKKYRAQYGGK